MRRDEIRIFPGNVETHISRLQQLPITTPPPMAAETPPAPTPEPPDPRLDYVAPAVLRRQRWRGGLAFFQAHGGMLLVILAPLSLVLFMMRHDLEAGLWMLISALVILVPPALMVAFVKVRQAWSRWKES